MQINKDIKTIWRYLRKYKKKVYFVIFLAILSSAIGATIPYIYGRLVDLAVRGSTGINLILGILGLWLFLALFSSWIDRRADKINSTVSMLSSNDLLLGLVYHVSNLPISFHKEKKMGEILQRVGRASEFFERIVQELTLSLGPGLLKAFIGLGILTYVEWRLSLGVFLTLGLFVVATFWKTKAIINTQKRLNKAYEKGYGDFYNATYNIGVVKSSIAEEFEKKRNIRNFSDIVNKFKVFIQAWIKMDAWQQTIIGFGFVFVFGIGIFFLRAGLVSAGELVMFVGYINLVYQPFAHLGNNYRMLKRGMVVINRALKLLKVKPERYEEGIELQDLRGEVVFDNVTFAYKKKKPVLRNINFKVRAGEIIALVGESGVGKSTLVDLISRYYSPNKGKILIDGHDIENVNLQSLRKHIAIVPQEVSLFNDSIKNNIAYGKPKAGMKKIIEVSKAANAHEFIDKFSKKYEQIVGERGIKLSVGQKQRVAIARALLRDPKILILDEATSALDSVSEKLVQEALKRLIQDRTTFIVAHRLSTISHADKIFVIKKGEIVERGTHQKLMKIKNGIYRNFYLMQSVFKEDLMNGKKE
jgi:ABC-type multidrug transport system fused ATPase/permease subunit